MSLRLFTALLLSLFFSNAYAVDNGFYIGGGLGSATIQSETLQSEQIEQTEFDSSDAGYKVFAGVRFYSLAIEASWIDFGAPDESSASGALTYELAGVDVSALLNLSFGFVDLYARGGLFVWESETQNGLENIDADGADPVYGVGLGLRLGSLSLRGEYQYFDVGDIDDVHLVSLSGAYTF